MRGRVEPDRPSGDDSRFGSVVDSPPTIDIELYYHFRQDLIHLTGLYAVDCQLVARHEYNARLELVPSRHSIVG